jgi:hypothetical protein
MAVVMTSRREKKKTCVFFDEQKWRGRWLKFEVIDGWWGFQKITAPL